jgi:NADH/NAD ratio-sensing transcriptional regulator Rex
MQEDSVNTVKMHERVAKLEERVDGGFEFVGNELKDIKDNHLHQLQSDVSDLKIKVNTIAVKVSVAVAIATILIDLAFRFLFR